MLAPLLRRFPSLPWLLLLLLGAAQSVQASHLLGGEMTYKYLGADGPAAAPHRYEVTTSVYVACHRSVTTSFLDLFIYDKATGARVVAAPAHLGSSNASVAGLSVEFTQPSISACTSIAVPAGCTITGASQPYQLQKFVGVICLPASSAGYYIVTAPGGGRNADINNLAGGGNASSGYQLSLYCTLAPPSIPNSSPVFTGNAVGLICASDTTVVLNNAVDADGDRLEYTFGQPYNYLANNPTFSLAGNYVPYTSSGGYSATSPLGTGAGYFAKIDPSTGVTKYVGGPTVGNRYGIAVDVTEYRTINGVEVSLGTTRRDIQLLVGLCPAVDPPVLPTAAIMPRSYTIEAGSTLRIPITGTQPAAHPLTLTATSVLLDGLGGHDASFANNPGTNTYAGSPVGAYTVASTAGGTVAGTFVFSPTCAQARATPYDVTLVLQDVGCAGKLASDVLRIMVVKPTGPTAIAGNLAVCGLNTTQTYTASGGTAATINWTVTNGTIVGSATANPVTVRWPAAGAGTITAQGISQAGCPLSQVTSNVVVSPAPALTLTGSQAICKGGSTTLSVSGGTAPYTVAGGPTPLSGTGPFVLSPTQTTTYTVTGTAPNGCPAVGQVTITVSPLPVATAGAAATSCPGSRMQLGAAPVAGLTYSWSPTAGLSSATVANPTVALANSTSAPITQTYTLTVTNANGCQASSTVVATVLPPPTAVPGAAATFCSGGSAQLGSAPVAGLTYSWSPATGLSSSTVANPTVTLPNATSAAATQTYTLTLTNAGGCAATSTVAVTVLPAVAPGTIGADQTVCAGAVPAPLTSTAPATGGTGTYAYQWESSSDNLTWAALANATGLTYAPGPVAATTYFRRRATAGACGPVYSNVVLLTARPLLATAVALPTLPAQCAGMAFTFVPTPINAGPAPTYRWLVNGAAVGTGPSYTSSTLADGDLVRVELTPTNGLCTSGGAVATARVSLTPVPAPTATIQLQTAMPACLGSPIAFGVGQAANASAGSQYQWQVDGIEVAGATGPSFTSSTLRDGQAVALVVRTTNACGQPTIATSAAVRVAVTAPVQVSAGLDKTIMEGETVVLEGTADGNYPVSWSPSPTLTLGAGNQLRPVVAPLATTTYTLAAGAGYCSNTSTVTVTVLPHVRIPNAFSPNGDSRDDTWQIDNIDQYANNHVTVFNRWGAKVFETANYSRSREWNGIINGQPTPVGTYYYLITLGNGKSFTGPITVVY
ncbi:gliding motility-associated C-terminal domain-containing protein [Hymenobacter sp. BT559]|uniref:T9SS type B sorting domain-containing protein n=1 Tax=Hymenobacter sp. BT559 TaxID=2795729 RepID=UPI0018ED5D52|nr:gliding motility-associated C-terminal domain-containing protein [Hymenobacter sp. BT559]MBJ6145090.1 gliding motility-associated C-terminal domain-containing protein [Hymenobacter sp. BT559]